MGLAPGQVTVPLRGLQRRQLGGLMPFTTWPQLPALSANSFVDHFDGGSLDTTKWTAVTSGTGSVSLSDSNCVIDTTATNQAAFIYRKTQLDLTKSQLWMVCFSLPAGINGGQVDQFLKVVNGASAPAAASKATIDGQTILQNLIFTGQTAGNTLGQGYYNNGRTVVNWWPGPSGPFAAFSASSGSTSVQGNDYYVTGLEIDGINSRWRMLAWGQVFATVNTFTVNQGWRLFGVTDWVTWANTSAQTGGLWLCLGHLFTDTATRSQTNLEWVRYAEAPAGNVVIDGWTNCSNLSTAKPQIRHSYSYDGQLFVPEDRTTLAIAVGGTYDVNEAVTPYVVYDGSSTDYLFYVGQDASNNESICVASAAHVASGPQNGPWTKYGSNPILSKGSSGANDDSRIREMVVICDQTESNSNLRWKMLYSAAKASDGKWRILYATAPAATGPWTKQGIAIDVGASGFDSAQVRTGGLAKFQGTWYQFYSAQDASGNWYTGVATAATFGGPYTKQGQYFQPGNVSQSLTAALSTAPGRTVSVGNTAGYRKDQRVVFSQTTAADTYCRSVVRKVVNSTTLELYHGVTGLNSTYPAKIRSIIDSPNFSPRDVIWDPTNARWVHYLVGWESFSGNSGDNASYSSSPQEEMFLATHTAAAPNGASITVSDLPYVTSNGNFGIDNESNENMYLLHSPVAQ